MLKMFFIGKQQPLIARQCEDLVVIHDRVERFDPHGVDVAVQENPLGPLALQVGDVAHDAAEQAILPLPCRRVDNPVQLVVGNGLGGN